MWQKISIIIPVLNEADNIKAFLQHLQPLRQYGHELIIVDGKSQDNTCELARPLVDRMFSSSPGRAKQQILGARMATGQAFLFLHADSILPKNADQKILSALSQGYFWGRFNVRLSGKSWPFRVIETMMNWRSRITGIATGDQGIFVAKVLYQDALGIPDIELMEDIAFSKRLKKFCKPACLSACLLTSSARWEKNGILSTILLMWSLRLQYFLGVSPIVLLKKYYPPNDCN